VITLVAKSIETNVRDLDSCINQIIAYADLIKVEPTFEIAQNIIKQLTNSFAPPVIDVSSIIKVVADHYKLSLSDLKGKNAARILPLPVKLRCISSVRQLIIQQQKSVPSLMARSYYCDALLPKN